MKKILLCALLIVCSFSAAAVTPREIAAAKQFAAILNDKAKLEKFMRKMPKGGDLHMHASGSTFAENMIIYALNDNLCVNRGTFTVYRNTQCPASDLLITAVQDQVFFDALVDAWSMQHFKLGHESGHDHFFGTFKKFSPIAHDHIGEILAEITDRAARQNELYVEVMITADKNQSGNLGKKLGFDPDFGKMRDQLLANHFDSIVAGMTTYLDEAEAKMRTVLACATPAAKPGCGLTLRYQYQVSREQAPEMVFAALLAGFEGAGKDKRIVAINMVNPEDGKIAMRDYKLHMQMVGFLHALYPNVHISLHAGELTRDLVPAEGVTFHIRDAVNVAHAERIGHGVDIAEETNFTEVLQKMAEARVMVEINLSSNAGILNVDGKNHPLPLYLQYGVPVALSTDDEGITRAILTSQYVHAARTYNLNYLTLKNMVRNSLAYSFLPGESLWQDSSYRQPAAACVNSLPVLSASCKQFLAGSEKARLQYKLEQQFIRFEKSL
jgi:adenosine deaminase